MQVAMIAIFGAVGCLARYFLSVRITQWLGSAFPYGILIINILGSFAIGLFAMLLMYRWQTDIMWRNAVIIGFLGGFTTFSSFSFDTVQMLEHGAWVKGITYILLSLVLCLLATFLGLILGRALHG